MFSVAISGLSFEEGEEATAVTLPAADGGDGQLSYSLTGLPQGMTFDAGTRALGGTPAEAGEFSLTYTATDEDGDQASFSLAITVEAAPVTARQTLVKPRVGSLTVTRAQSATPMSPALDVSWTKPDDIGLTISWYKLQYRKQGAAEWTEDSTVIETTSHRLTNLEAGATYEVQVATGTNEQGLGDWSETGSGQANRAPTATSAAFNGGTFPVGSVATYAETGQGALGPFFSDADGDTLTYTASSQHPALLGVSLSGSAGSATLTATLLNQGASTLTLTATDAFGGHVTRTATITVTAKTSRSIAENSAAGTAVGAPVTGTPYNGVALSYTLTGKAADSGKFVIDPASGQISLAEGATLDYETDDAHRETETFNGQVIAKFYRGEVHYTVDGHAAVISVTIKVTDVAPVVASAPTLTRTEFSEPTDPALDVTWTAASANGTTITGYEAQYRKQVAKGEEANAWTDYSGTLGATATTFNLASLEAGAIYEAQVRAVSSDEGAGPWSDTGSGRANRPPAGNGVGYASATHPYKRNRIYNAGDRISTHFVDADGDTLTYSATPADPPLADAWTQGDALVVAAKNAGNSSVTYRASDPYGGVSADALHSFTVTANETRTVAENAAAETMLGDRVQGVPHNGETLRYTLTGELATSGHFYIKPRGRIRVKSGAVLDYETKSSYTGKVEYTVGGHATAINVTVNLIDLEAGKPGTPTVTRTRFSEPTGPALDVAWTAAPANGTTITGYEAQYRVKVAEGETANAWTDYTVDDGNGVQTKTLSASTRSINLPDLTAGTTYEFQVRALTRLEGEGPWSDIGEGAANRPPTASSTPFNGGTFPVGTIATYAETGQGALGVFFGDADGDALTYSASAQHPALLGVSLSGAAGSATLTATQLNQGASKLTFTASDPYGGQVTRTTTLTATHKESREIAENSAAGTAVGTPVTGTPYDDGDEETDDALSYTLTGKAKDSGKFVIDSASGQISLAQGATLDYETDDAHRETETWNGEVIAKFYRGEVHYTVDGHAAVINVSVIVTDVTPSTPAAPTLTRTTFSEPSDPALDVTWTAPPADGLTINGYNVQYRVQVADGETANAWTDYTVTDANDQQTTTLPTSTTSINLPGLTAGTTYEAQVRAVTSEGDSPWSDTGSGRANRPPNATSTAFNGGTFSVGAVATYAETGQGALGVFFGDADGDTLTYAASSQHPALLGVSLSGTAGSATLTATLLNPGASTITFTASDPYGGQVTRTTTITGSPKTVSRSVAENSAAGTAVGEPVTGVPYDDGDEETDDALSYTLSGGPSTLANFEIDSATGQISVKQGASLDYEIENSYSGTVNYTVDGHAAVINVSISVTDVEAGKPAAPTLTRTTFSQQSNPALDVTWTAPAANGTTITGYEVQYRVKVAQGETANAWTDYTVTDSEENPTKTLPTTPTSINLPDLTAGTTYEAQVRALTSKEGPGPWSDIGEARANRPPRLTSPSNTGLFLTLRWSDAATLRPISGDFVDDDSDTLTYSASAAHAGVIGVSIEGSDPTNVKMEVLNPATTTVTYGVSDGYGGYVSINLDVTGVATRLTGSELTRDIDENSPAGTAVGDPVTGTPYDDGNDETDDALTYTLTGAAASTFVIDSSTGQISVKQGATLDYETTTSYAGSVLWSVQDQEAEAEITISVLDLEAGKPDTPSVTRTEFSEPSNPALDVTWTAPAANRTTITGYEARYRVKVAQGQPANAWTDHTVTGSDGNPTKTLPATTTSFNLPNRDAGTPYEAQVRALTSKEGPGPWSDLGEGRVNTPPNGTSLGIANGSFAVGVFVKSSSPAADYFSDADGDTLTYSTSSNYRGVAYSYVGIDPDVEGNPVKFWARAINPSTATITYGASDAYGGYASKSWNITGVANPTRSVPENSPAGTAVGAPVVGSSWEGRPVTFTYTLTGEAADFFAINSATGQISVKQGTTLDYETKTSYTGQVHWTVQEQPAVANLTINVEDLEAGKPDAPTVTRTEFSEQSNPALDVTWTKPADNGLTISWYKVQYRKQAAAGEDPADWTLHSAALETTSMTLSDLEAGVLSARKLIQTAPGK
ncbi:MAG: fibronectin type III domain-containing protein [Chloroflexi bacterium]|nr:fibronectin type III domain-containing protein [Chloroflexota bacterium]